MLSILMAEEEMSILEKLGFGGSTFLLGLCTVFLVLALLIGFIKILSLLINAMEKRKVKKEDGINTEESVKEPMITVSGDRDEIVAAISGALAVIYAEQQKIDGKTVSFRVRSIKEIK